MSDYFADQYFNNESLEKLKTKITPSWDEKTTKAHLSNIAIPPSAKAILEVGCGIGRLAKRILSDNPKAIYVGIDASESMIAEADNYTQSSRATFMHCKGDGSLPDLGSKFDFVFAWLVFQHIADCKAVLQYVQTMADLTNKNGQMVMQLLRRDEKPGNKLWTYHDIGTITNLMIECNFRHILIEPQKRWTIVRGVK